MWGGMLFVLPRVLDVGAVSGGGVGRAVDDRVVVVVRGTIGSRTTTVSIGTGFHGFFLLVSECANICLRATRTLSETFHTQPQFSGATHLKL